MLINDTPSHLTKVLGSPSRLLDANKYFSTDEAPAVAEVGNNAYFFAKSPDGRLFYNRAQLGQDGVGWKEVDGNGRFASAPAAAGVGTHIFVAARGLDGQLYLNQTDLGHPFNNFWFPMR